MSTIILHTCYDQKSYLFPEKKSEPATAHQNHYIILSLFCQPMEPCFFGMAGMTFWHELKARRAGVPILPSRSLD